MGVVIGTRLLWRGPRDWILHTPAGATLGQPRPSDVAHVSVLNPEIAIHSCLLIKLFYLNFAIFLFLLIHNH